MKINKYLALPLVFSLSQTYAMGLRSFVALPINTGGGVVRFLNDYNFDANTDVFISALAYGISPKQSLFFALPTRLNPTGARRLGDFSALYRHTLFQKDNANGTNRLGFLGGFVLPTSSTRDSAAQAGFVFTRYHNRYEIDVDALYQKGFDNRGDSGRYDVSWQYRINPKILPEWGISNQLFTVLELNSRWQQGNSTSQQLTAGLTWAKAKYVVEGGFVKELNHREDTHFVLSARFHF